MEIKLKCPTVKFRLKAFFVFSFLSFESLNNNNNNNDDDDDADNDETTKGKVNRAAAAATTTWNTMQLLTLRDLETEKSWWGFYLVDIEHNIRKRRKNRKITYLEKKKEINQFFNYRVEVRNFYMWKNLLKSRNCELKQYMCIWTVLVKLLWIKKCLG